MISPRLIINLDKIYFNACTLIGALQRNGISVTGVTKAILGSPEIAGTLLRSGVKSLGDSRIENIETMRLAGIRSEMVLIRSPMISQVDRVVAGSDISFNTELDVISKLSQAAKKAGRDHGIVLMVELGDLREGILPKDILQTVRKTLTFPNIIFKGIGTNLACRSGVSPDENNMSELSDLADSIEAALPVKAGIVSGGNSANLQWASSGISTGRVNNLRLGESILLGCEPLHRKPIMGLYTDAVTLIAEVIESKVKPALPRGIIAQSAFGEIRHTSDSGAGSQTILALGRQDIDPEGLSPPSGVKILGASSDHLIIYKKHSSPGDEITFNLNYSAMLRSMTSPFVAKIMVGSRVMAV